MNINNLFFHIHYCNGRQTGKAGKYPKITARVLQHHELVFIKGGRGHIIIGGKRYQIRDGMLFYIHPGAVHSIEIDAKEGGGFLSVHFSYARVSYNDGGWTVGAEAETLPLHPAQQLRDYYHMDDTFKKLVESWYGKLPGYEFTAGTLLQQLLGEILQNVRRQNQNYSASLKVERIIQYLHRRVSGRVTLAELAELVQLAPTYLSRAFREATGYSVIEYFNRMKIDKAKELFIEGNIRVKGVAQALGFSDEFYFSRIFKKIEGISPSEYYNKNVHGV